jgi:hypothetical protein
MQITSIGIDLGKTTFHLVAFGSTKRPDTFTQTVASLNFKPLAVRRRTIHFRQLH